MPGARQYPLQALRAERIFNDVRQKRRVSEDASSLQEVRASIERRFASEQKRYMTLYSVDPTDPKNFDFILDTKDNSLDNVVTILLEKYSHWRVQ